MHGQRIAAVLFAVLMVTSMVAVPGTVAAQEDGPDATEPASYYGTVEIDGELADSDTTVSAVVDGEVVDTADVNESGWYSGPDLFDEKLTVSAEDAENDTTVEFRVNGEPVTRTDPSPVEWESGDIQRVNLRAGTLDPIYDFDVEDSDGSVARGDRAEITVSVENTGDPGADELTVTAAGEDDPRVNRSLDLDTNETTTEVLSVPTREADGDQVTFTVATDEDSAEVTVDLLDPSNVTVDLEVDEPASGNEYDPTADDLNGTVTVENVGEVTDKQTVSVSVGDETLVDRAIELDGGTNKTIEFDRALTADDAGETTLTATTDDDIATQTLSVLRPGAFAVDVIEDESTLDPIAGQNVSVVAEIENVGDSSVEDTVTLVNVTEDTSDEIASEPFDLDPGEVQDFEASVETTDADAGSDRTYEIAAGDDDTETVQVAVGNRDAFLDVTISDLNKSTVKEPTAGETVPVRVNATVENLGTEPVDGNLTGFIDGEAVNSTTISLDGSESKEFSDTLAVELGDAPRVNLRAAAERDGVDESDSTDEATVTVTPQAEFAVSIEEAANVSGDLSSEAFAPTVSVENVGGQTAPGTVSVFFNGTEQGVVEFDSLDPDSSTEVIKPNDGFSINASDFDPGEYLLEAEAANESVDTADSDTDRVAIGEVANFTVTDLTVPASADQGETVTVSATVKNTGGVRAERPVTIEVGDRTLQTTVLNLTDAGSDTVSVDYTPTSAVAGTSPTVTVSTPDDERSATVDVRESAEFTADLTVAQSAIAGDDLTAAVTVRNVGGNASNATDVRLLAGGQEVDNATGVELAAGEQTTQRFTLSPESAGELSVQGVTDDDVAGATVDVGEPGELEIGVRSITDPVTTDENVTVSVAAENIGDGDLDGRPARLSIDGELADTATVDVAGGTTRSVELTSTINRTIADGEIETAEIAIVTPEDRVDRDVTVRPAPDDAYFRVDGLAASADEVLNTTDATVTVNASVRNIGDLDGTQNVTFTAGNTVSETNQSLGVDNGSATNVSFEFDVSELGLSLADEESTEVDYTIGTKNQTATGTLTVAEPAPATPELVDVVVDERATQETDLAASVTVVNTGDQPLNGTETVTLEYEDGTVANDSVALNASVGDGGSLAPGAEATVDLAVSPPAEPRAGVFEREVTVGFGSEAFADDMVTRTVAVGFEGVASGVDAAEAGDTVTVRSGEYQARNTIEIPSGVTVESGSPIATPVIRQPSRTDDTAVRIVGDDVGLNGLAFEGDGNGTAVKIAADDASLTSVRATNWSTGIDETAGTNALTGVEVSDTGIGIRIAGDNQTAVDFARVTDASDTGIRVESGENVITGAEVLRSATGIELFGADNEIRGSTVRNSPDYGIRVTEVSGDLDETSEIPPSATINASVLESNGVSVFSDGSAVDATDNWWGTPVPRQNVDYVARSEIDPSGSLESRPESTFRIDADDIPGQVLRDTTFTVEPTIVNDGSANDLQRIELRRDDGTVVDSETVSLDASEDKTVSLSGSTTAADGDTVTLRVASLDDTSTADVNVDDPAAFSLGGLSTATSTIPLGSDLVVDTQVDNLGDRQGTATARLVDVDGDVVDSTDIDVDGSTSQTPSLTWETDVQGTGQQVTVEILDGGSVVASDTLAVDVTAPELSGVSLAVSDDALSVGGTTTASVTETLTDGSSGEVTGATTLKSSDSTVVSVNGATLTAESAGTATVTAEYSSGGITRSDAVTVSVTAVNDGDDGTGGDGGDGGDDDDEGVPVGDDPTTSLELTPVATETVSTVADGETNQQVATFDAVSNVRSIAFDGTNQVGDVTVADVDPESAGVNPPGAAVTVQEILVSGDEDRPATISFSVSADRLETVGAEPSELTAVRLNDGEWEPLETTVSEETADGVTLQAEAPGFSVFAVNAVSDPDATAAIDPGTVTAGEEVTLDGGDSTDEYGEIVAYDWSLAGQSISGETTTATVDEPGEYTVELTVTNDAGETDTTTATLAVEPAADSGDGPDDDGPDDDDPTDEPAGLGTTAIALLVALALLAVATVVWARRNG